MSYTELSSRHVVGKKKYACSWCNHRIEKGERHHKRVYIYEGEFQTGRMHLECEQEMLKAPHDELADGWMPGDFPPPERLKKKEGEG